MFDKINFKSYEIAETMMLIMMIAIAIFLLAIGGAVVYDKVTNSPEKIKRKYINEGYKGEIVIIESCDNKTKEILIKNNNELIDEIKKEIVEKEVAK